jgi:hypothetical protein
MNELHRLTHNETDVIPLNVLANINNNIDKPAVNRSHLSSY